MLVNMLSGGSKEIEMVYLEKFLNLVKGKVGTLLPSPNHN
jgi:hypothetical protein